MARMPGANWLGEHAGPEDGFITSHDIVCIHTIVGHDPAHAAHFSTDWSSGEIGQSRDTARQSDANAFGNDRVIAIENEDFPDAGEDGVSGGPLSDAQVESCARILAWAHKTHGVPLQYCPDSKPGSRGLAVHRQGIDGNFLLPDNTHGLPRSMWLGRVDGGELWTESFGKECPRNNKIAQVPAILRRAKEIVNGETDPLEEIMAWYDNKRDFENAIENAAARGTWNRHLGSKEDGAKASLFLIWAARRAADVRGDLEALAAEAETHATTRHLAGRARAILAKLREIDDQVEAEEPA